MVELLDLWANPYFVNIFLPMIVTVLTARLCYYYPKMVSLTKSRFARKRAIKLIQQATICVGSHSQGATSILMLMRLSHLIVRVTALLAGLMITMMFYSITFFDNANAIGSPLLVMAVLDGVIMSMVANTWNEMSDIGIASMGPGQYLDGVEEKLGPIYRKEFEAEVVGLRSLAETILKQQKGMFGIATLAEGLIYGERKGSTESPVPQAPNSPVAQTLKG